MIFCVVDQDNVCVNKISINGENPRFLLQGQSYATDHTGKIGDTWNGSEWVSPVVEGVTEPKPEEQLADEVRYTRQILLDASDWVVTKSLELGVTIPTEWTTYRQALRDITAQEGFPTSVTWPTKPE